jgi:hypothetical protein
MAKGPVRRKPEAERKKRAITVWVDDEQGALLDRAAGDIPVSTWTRSVALKAAREALGEAKGR